MANFRFWASSLTGGGTGALDSIDVTLAALTDGDTAVVITATDKYDYLYDDDNAGAESSPHIIAPDLSNGGAYTGDARWVLTNRISFLPDTDQSNFLEMKWNEDDSSDRVFNLLVNSGDRTLDMSASLDVDAACSLDQNLKTTASPTFAQVTTPIVAATSDLYLNATNYIKYGTYTATADKVISGYVEIRDSGGTLRKLAVIA